MTASTCLNQSTDIFLQPSPYDAVELIIYTLKFSQRPVDILVLGPLTNIAAAIMRDRSIVPKIGTLYVSGEYYSCTRLPLPSIDFNCEGGQFKSLADFTSLVPNANLGFFPYSWKTSGSSSNAFLGESSWLANEQSQISRFYSQTFLPLSVLTRAE